MIEQSESGAHSLVAPPAVDYPLSHARMLRMLARLAWGTAAAIDGYWLVAAPAGDWRPWVATAVTACAGALAWRAGPMTQSGNLAWDGTAWFWECSGSRLPGYVQVHLDLQSGLLVRFVTDAGSAHWAWLDRAARPGQWLALRRAVHGTVRQHDVPGRGTARQAAVP